MSNGRHATVTVLGWVTFPGPTSADNADSPLCATPRAQAQSRPSGARRASASLLAAHLMLADPQQALDGAA
jgi:hypothetical protein